MENKDLTVIDFFCGAGGFSEGFRQQGFKIVKGIDYWQPAIDTHNLNHGLKDTTKSVLDYWSENTGNVDEIEKLEDTQGIIGSPPCVSFSSSNKSGKADKDDGIKLIEAYLRVIAVKKHKKGSKLLFWYMENVPNSRKFVKEEYTFESLNLSDWAINNGLNPDETALKVKDSGQILDSGDYGAPQSRKRFIAGEWCKTGIFPFPEITHTKHVALGDVLDKMPKPIFSKKEVYKNTYNDPNYKELIINGAELTDHFYDTGIYEIEWEDAKYLKQSHSYMGVMSFPENKNRPCRTIMATRSAKTREALIYKSEYNRVGNGEYRLPTIREISSLMGFPYTYQFAGSEGSKWRQIGNAVSPHLASALAKCIRKLIGLDEISNINFSYSTNLFLGVTNLNTFEEKIFNTPKKRRPNARFRRHPYKSGNMTVELINYNSTTDLAGLAWYVEVYFGTGLGYNKIKYTKNEINKLEKFLEQNVEQFKEYKSEFQAFSDKLLKIDSSSIQLTYESDLSLNNNQNPLLIVKRIGSLICTKEEREKLISGYNFIPKNQVPIGQLYAIYSLGKLFY